MHILVQGSELVEVAVARACQTIGKPFDQRVQHVGHIVLHFVQGIDRQVPALVMGNGDGIVEIVAARQQ